MSTHTDIELHEGEDWQITLSAHYADGTTMSLTSGDEVTFRVADADGALLLDKTVGDGIVISDEPGGVAIITVMAVEQYPDIVSGGAYWYEVRVVKGSINPQSYIQAEGRLIVAHSLFGSEINPLLLQFRLRFTEFSDVDDGVISRYLDDASNAVDAISSGWSIADIAEAKIYLAAHYVQLRRRAYDYSSMAMGAVQSISVEDRSVSFQRTNTTSLSSTMSQTIYGDHYVAIRQRYPVWLKRA